MLEKGIILRNTNTFGNDTLVDEARDDMRSLKIKVVMGPIHIRRDHRCKIASVLVLVALVHDINHALGISVSIVGVVRIPIVDHGLINWVRRLVWENTGRETRDNFFDLSITELLSKVSIMHKIECKYVQLVGSLEDVQVDERVVTVKV